MSWRVVCIGSKAKLDYKMDYLVVRTEEKTTRIYLGEISVLMVSSCAVSLTAYLLCELIKHKIRVVFCDEKALPLCEAVPLYGSHDTSRKVREQLGWDRERFGFVWAEIVRAKILGQRAVLPAECAREKNLLSSYADEIAPLDPTNREGHAAKVYFNALFGKEFSRNDENFINAALNYGYSILLSAIGREITACGYITQLGIFHDNVFNPHNLTCDLMEPFRPFVDALVYKMQPVAFGHEEKMKMLNVLNLTVSIAKKEQILNNALRIYVGSVFDALREGAVSGIHFPDYELSLYETSGIF